MSMLSRWTIGAMASKKARASLPVTLAMALGQAGRGQRAGGDDRRAGGGQGVDPLAHDSSMLGWASIARVTSAAKALAVDRQRRPGGDPVRVRRGHDQRIQRAHFLVEQPDRIAGRVVGAEAVRADHFGEPVAVVRRGGVAAAAHFAQANAKTRFGKLPGRFRTGEPAADDVNLVCHAGVR